MNPPIPETVGVGVHWLCIPDFVCSICNHGEEMAVVHVVPVGTESLTCSKCGAENPLPVDAVVLTELDRMKLGISCVTPASN